MRFEALLDRHERGGLSQIEAAEMLGVSERTFRRRREPLRPHFVRAKVRVHEYPDGRLAVFWGPHRLADYDAEGRSIINHALAARAALAARIVSQGVV